MENDKNLEQEKLALALKNYLKLTKQPGLSAGARTVLLLQIEHIQNLIQKRVN